MKAVIIAEKPSVANDIAVALGGFKKVQSWYESERAIITNGFGHLVECFSQEMELPASNQLTGLPVLAQQFKLRPRKNAGTQLSLIKKLLQRDDVSHIVNACDAGREGELIFRLIVAATGVRKPIKRMWYTSMTKESLRAAYENIADGSKYNNLYESALCRTESDYLVGLNASKGISDCQSILTRKKVFMRAGRVQTPVLALIVDRENEIKNFVPRAFSEIIGTFSTKNGQYDAVLHLKDGDSTTTRIFDKTVFEELLNRLKNATVERAVDQLNSITTRSPKLFSLGELQKAANKKYRFTSQETLDLTQKLYETHKMVTYPRTSADALPEDYVENVLSIISDTFTGTQYEKYVPEALKSGKISQNNKQAFDNSRISDHFAIIPAVNSKANINALSENEKKIYDLIVKRFFSTFYPDAHFDETVRTTTVDGMIFIVKGKILTQEGWLALSESRKSDMTLCPLDDGLPHVANIQGKMGKTTAPSRYDDGSLLTVMINAGRLIDDEELSSAMKANGLGTEATRAGIIEGLVKAKSGSGKPIEPYVLRDKSGYYSPTPLAYQLIEFCRKSGLEVLTSPVLTGEWESKLAQVEAGKVARQEFMQGIRLQVSQLIDSLKDKISDVDVAQALVFSNAHCPKCNSGLNDFVDHVNCQKHCGFRLFKNMFGRSFTDNELRELIKNGSTPFYDNFKSASTSKEYSAKIIFDTAHSPKLEFKKPELSPTDLKCPCCEQHLMKAEGKFVSLVCTPCNFSLSTVIASRRMSKDELTTLISTGYLNSRTGFVSSKSDKNFTAALSLDKKTGKVTFSFDN